MNANDSSTAAIDQAARAPAAGVEAIWRVGIGFVAAGLSWLLVATIRLVSSPDQANYWDMAASRIVPWLFVTGSIAFTAASWFTFSLRSHVEAARWALNMAPVGVVPCLWVLLHEAYADVRGAMSWLLPTRGEVHLGGIFIMGLIAFPQFWRGGVPRPWRKEDTLAVTVLVYGILGLASRVAPVLDKARFDSAMMAVGILLLVPAVALGFSAAWASFKAPVADTRGWSVLVWLAVAPTVLVSSLLVWVYGSFA